MTIIMPGHSHTGPLTPFTAQEQALSTALEQHVRMLSEHIGERHIWRPGSLEQSQQYIRAQLEALGYEVTEQAFTAQDATVVNLEAVRAGSTQGDEVIVVGAHYDTIRGTPGANDNASGVAAVLEIARLLKDIQPARELRLVAFVNEEPPFFHNAEMGSLVYAKHLAAQQKKVVAMISLETIGYYQDDAGSQHYPSPFDKLYPDTGNFIGVVGNFDSRELVHSIVGHFRESTAFPCEGAVMPEGVEGAGWSDHWSFWQAGYAAVMVTDTAPFRYPYYHKAGDTPEKLDYARMGRVVGGFGEVVKALLSASLM